MPGSTSAAFAALVRSVRSLSKDAEEQLEELRQLGLAVEVSLGVDELALQFYDHAILAEQLYHGRHITKQQLDLLRHIDNLLGNMSGKENAELWTPSALRISPRWANVRLIANEFIGKVICLLEPSSVTVQLLQHQVRQSLLLEWDPIGIREYSEAQDEYDSYVTELCQLLINRASEEEILNHLWYVETQHMGLSGRLEATISFAKRLLQIRDDVLGAG